jgi:hypothetical protein
MALYDTPPHACDVYAVASGPDAGGGVQLAYTLLQAACPCSIDTASASEQLRFAQQAVVVTHRVAFLSSALTTPLGRGMKLVASDTGASYNVRGISAGRQYGGVPPFTYAFCEEQT